MGRWAFLVLLAVAGCGELAAPTGRDVRLQVQSGMDQYGLINATLTESLQVIALDPISNRPLANVRVDWRVASGLGGNITPVSVVTGSNGVAVAAARLGPLLGPYTFEATAPRLIGGPAVFSARSVLRPTITSISTTTANAGDTITITGTNFSPFSSENAVLFSGLRGRIVSTSSTQLRVAVPECMPTRTASLVVALGVVTSAPQSISVLARPTTPLPLQVGETRVIRSANELACLRLEPPAGAQFLLIQQNVSNVVGSMMPFELNSLTGTEPLALRSAGFATASRPHFGQTWEGRLRAQERAFRGISAEPMPMALRVSPPEIGERASFQVYDRNDRFVSVTAEVKAISERAIIYQDVNAPANGFTESQFRLLGSMFDSPTYEVDVSVFGEPPDIDANGKIVILLTPVVNELTPRGANGYVAGFFFGCDLQSKSLCAGSNSAEIFYVFVPDPTGRHGDARSAQLVLNTAMPVLVHEFEHMISFGARKVLDNLWLSEGLAHHAEDLVADEFRRRGDAQSANLYTAQNYARARIFLRDSTYGSLLSEELPGSLEQRGAGWLLVKYLAGHYGGNTLLRTLSRSSLSGIDNVVAATGQSWSSLMSDWAVALWADDAPELTGTQLNARHSFNNINLREVLSSQSSYPLRVTQLGFSDVLLAGSLAASTHRYVLLDGMSTPALPVNLAFTGPLGGSFSLGGAPQLTVLRIR